MPKTLSLFEKVTGLAKSYLGLEKFKLRAVVYKRLNIKDYENRHFIRLLANYD